MVKSVSCCCVRGRRLFSNLVTYILLLLYYNSKQNIPYNWPTGSQQVLSSICIIYLEYVTKGHIAMHTIFVLNLKWLFSLVS